MVIYSPNKVIFDGEIISAMLIHAYINNVCYTSKAYFYIQLFILNFETTFFLSSSFRNLNIV